MGDEHEVSQMTPEELHKEFPPAQHAPEPDDPLEHLAQRGMTEVTPMGLGPVLSWVIVIAFLALVVAIFLYWVFVYPH